ncbi:MAG: hypothetical protein H0T51_16440 [Pirellulales bacterium]|nr:hypothetical protein [Pirellulales bacterium]
MPPKKKGSASDGHLDESTVIWGKKLESGDFIKVPRALLRIYRYRDGLADKLKPRHILLLLVLASRRFKEKPLRVYWEELADDLGVSRETVRKWAYELIEEGWLTTTQVRGRDKTDKRIGYRNERNIFDIGPFVELVKEAKAERDRQKDARAQGEEQ